LTHRSKKHRVAIYADGVTLKIYTAVLPPSTGTIAPWTKLAVNFQEVVHSAPAVNADVAKTQ
jgi:hypothetical protein